MEIQTRQLVDADWQIYREIRLAALKDAPDAFGSTLEREQAFSDETWRSRVAVLPTRYPLGAFDGVRLVGLACGVVSTSEPGRGDIYQMFVDPAYRGRGLARRLLEPILLWLRERGVIEIWLSVSLGNPAAEGLYRSLGFEPVGPPTPLREGSDVLSQDMRLRRFGE